MVSFSFGQSWFCFLSRIGGAPAGSKRPRHSGFLSNSGRIIFVLNQDVQKYI